MNRPCYAGYRASVAAGDSRPTWEFMRRFILILLPLVLALSGCGSATNRPTPPPLRAASPPPSTIPRPLQLCLVTRDHGIPESYVPPDLVALQQGPAIGPAVLMRPEAATALMQLLDGARAQRVYLIAISGYRSAEQQRDVLQQETKLYGPAKANSEVAPPGHSEHQLGVAVDVLAARDPNDLDQSFGATPEGQWLAANAPAYGFVISYPAGKDGITGYVYEPWHIRFVGLPLSWSVIGAGQTLTEFLPAHGMDGCDEQNAQTGRP